MIWTFARGGAKRLDPARAVALVNLERGVFVDIRAEEEFARGHIARARHIPIDKIDSRADDLTKFRDKPVVVVCGNGTQSPANRKEVGGARFSANFRARRRRRGVDRIAIAARFRSAQKAPLVSDDAAPTTPAAANDAPRPSFRIDNISVKTSRSKSPKISSRRTSAPRRI